MGCCASERKKPQQSQPPVHKEPSNSSQVNAPHPKSEVKPTPQAHDLTKGRLEQANHLALQGDYLGAIKIYQQHIENSLPGQEDIDGVGMDELGIGSYEWFPLQWYKGSIESKQCKGTAYDALSLCYGRVMSNEEEVIRGTSWYRSMVDDNPRNVGLLMGLANILSNQGISSEGLYYYEKVAVLKPNWVRPLQCSCLLVEYQKGDKEKATELANKIIKMQFENKVALFILARNEDNVEAKIAKLKELVGMYPKYGRAYNQLGMVYGGENQDHRSAIEWFQKATEITPQYYSCYNNAGLNYQLLKNPDQAMHWYLRALQQNKNYKAPHKNLSYIFSAKNFSEQKVAIQITKYKIAEDYFYYYLAMAFYERKKYDQAIGYYNKAQECAKEELRKQIHKVYNAMGIVYEDKGDLKQAQHYYQKSIDENRNFCDAYFNMAVLHRKQNNLKESTYWNQQAIEINPYFSQAYNNLGDLQREKYMYEEAINFYQLALKYNPTLSLTQTNLAVCYFKLHLEPKAFSCIGRARKLLLHDRQAISNENKSHLQQILNLFDREGDCWKQEPISDQRKKINNIIQNYELKFSSEEGKIWEDLPTDKQLKKEVLDIVKLVHEDKLGLNNISKVYEIVRDLSKDNIEYFHIIPRLLAHFYFTQCISNNRPIVEVEKQARDIVAKMVTKAKEECGKGKQRKNRREPLKTKNYEDKGKKVNLFRAKYFGNSSELYKELIAMRDTANHYYKDFKALVQGISEDSFGTLERIEVKIPYDEKDAHPQLLQIFERIFTNELTKDKLQTIIKKVDEVLQDNLKGRQEINKFPKDELVFKIMEVWIQEINDIVSRRSHNQVETKCELTDLISSSISFKSLDHLSKAVESTSERCFAMNYQILKIDNRLNDPQHEDVMLHIYIGETVCSLKLTLKQDPRQQEFLQAIQSIEQCPLGCLFGSFVFLQGGVLYPFSDNCLDIEELLKGGEILRDDKALEGAEYVVKSFDQYPSI